jgi:hypothetical protein
MSDSNKVVYELDLRDGSFHKVLDGAEHHVKKFEGAFESLKERGIATLESLGFAFGAFEAVEFIKSSREEYEKLEQANSQLEAGLESTHHAAGLTFEDLSEQAEKFSNHLRFTQADVESMQSILLTFTSVTNKTFEGASQAVLDMATRLKTDASSAALQLGKALQDPVAGLGALHRVGVNVEELRKKFVHTTDTLARQKLIIAELNEEFGHSAQASAAADKAFAFSKSMEQLKLMIGQAAMAITEFLAPALTWFVNALKESIKWMKDHKDLLQAIAIGVGVAIVAWGTYELIVNAAAIATGIMTAAQWLLNIAMDANPIGLIIIALGALVTAIVYAYKHFETFHAFIWGLWATLKEFGSIVVDVFEGVAKVIHGVVTFDWKEIKEGGLQAISAIGESGVRMGNAFQKGFQEGMKDFKESHEESNSLVPKEKFKAKSLGQGAAIKEPKTKATGNKNITINVAIKDLIGSFTTNVTNLKESNDQLRRLVIETLASGVNDFQVVADH